MSSRPKANKETGLYRFARGIAFLLLHLFFPVRYEGLENIPKGGGYILCSNHRSAMDVIYLGYHVPQQLRFMAKAELFRKKIAAWFFRTMGAFPVERGRGDLHALDEAGEIIREGGVMAIFPEGTRSRDGKPLPFHSGFAVVAAHTGADVLPAAISFEGKVRPWKRVTVRFAPLIPYESFGFSQEPARSELRNAIRLVQISILDRTDLPAEYVAEQKALTERKAAKAAEREAAASASGERKNAAPEENRADDSAAGEQR